MSRAEWRIGVDVGGTFNDLVAIRESDGRRVAWKQPSTPGDPSLAVEQGLRDLMARAGIGPGQVARITHGTTLALNTILQRKGARLALVVSRGNGDVLEIARSRMPTAFDFTAKRETPLIPRNRVFELGARVLADGTIHAWPDAAEFADLARRIRAARVDAVAVMLLNSWRHPAPEAEAAEALAALLPGMAITASAGIWPEIREYERGLLAALNAYVQPMMEGYFDRLSARLAGLGLVAPLWISTSNGGSVSLASARARPIDAALSGPAAGVAAAIRETPAHIRDRIVTLDMGGTSTDMAVVVDGVPEFTSEARIGDFPIILPVVAVTAIGAGGGSKIALDAQGVLKVGPESAGSDPGPVAYGRGGTVPTVTDCYLATGILDAATFLGGRMPLSSGAAEAALAGLGAEGAAAAASAALRVATAMMAVELSKLLARRGLDHRDFTLVAFGGAGATHAAMLAEEAGLRRVLIPRSPGTFCALGAALSELRRDQARSCSLVLAGDGTGFAAVRGLIAELMAEGTAWARGETGAADLPLAWALMAEMRFPDQAHALEVHVPEALRDGLDGPALLALFHAEHERLYGFSSRENRVLVSTLRLAVRVPEADLPPPPGAVGEGGAPARGEGSGIRATKKPMDRLAPARRNVFHGGAWHEAALYRREALAAGQVVRGPAVVEQDDTTIWIVPGWAGTMLADGNLVLTRAGTEGRA